MKVKEEREKVGLKLNIQKTNIMASGLITSWQIDGETVETVTDFIFLGSKITADGDWARGNLELANAPTNPVITKLMLFMIAVCSINCQTRFVSAQVNKLQHAVPGQ